ncbi:hypothetical protein NJC40_13675 [Pseudomonas sp. 21LCFQ02]|uniref:hypothetical protein n=1 Tax=Pseudomonas sp. 21LCFQ02 TaxID=2957505 RepID=UPI00209AA43B|nr:hypothetical protein [Pseudomonas sp. 21LCFQ02]MCO8168818.1 hypothetical protein [Pseudomonas sp. 21LCFQ02]
MNAITGLTPLSPLYKTQLSTTLPVQPAGQTSADTSLPATSVILGQDNSVSDSQTYSRQGQMPGAQTHYSWEADATDSLSALILAQLKSGPNGARFQGLGAALLEQLAANGGKAISQSVFASGSEISGPAALKPLQDDLRAHPNNSLTFSLTTASGATVQLSLASNDQGLAVNAEVLGGELSASELKGLSALASSFQSAIDGLSQVPPKLQLGELTQLDPKLFTSLQLNAKLQTPDGDQLFELRLDEKSRSVSLQGPSGELKLELDASNLQLLGNVTQRQSAINSYLEQFDAAQKRGQGDKDLISLFKDAFVQLNSADDQRSAAAEDRLSEKDRTLLSGLADFSASINETERYNNPMRPLEAERFSYTVSQTSSVNDEKPLELDVQQQQQSALKASYHQSLNPLVALTLSSERESQNYRYYEINDQASSSTRIAYHKGRLIEASATQQSTQNERVRTYVNGDLTRDLQTPASVTESRNLLSMINEVFEQERISQRDHRVSVLEGLLMPQRKNWLLQSSASKIAD